MQNNLAITRDDMKNIQILDRAGEVMAVREAKQIEGMVLMAKRFPRDMIEVEKKILVNCRRNGLAEMAEYTYKRGGVDITGPSIRLAEVLMQCYGNMLASWHEVQRNSDNSDCIAYAWDIENNIRIEKSFNVPHYRDTRQGRIPLKDDRDIKEMCANQAARVLRSCILQVIPGDLIEMALNECHKTLENDRTPLHEQIAKFLKLFKDEYNVSQAQLERYIGVPVTKWTKSDIHRLRKLNNLIKNGESTVEEALSINTARISGAQLKDLAALIMKMGQEKGMAVVNMMGYAELKDIPAADFEAVKEALTIKPEPEEKKLEKSTEKQGKPNKEESELSKEAEQQLFNS